MTDNNKIPNARMSINQRAVAAWRREAGDRGGLKKAQAVVEGDRGEEGECRQATLHHSPLRVHRRGQIHVEEGKPVLVTRHAALTYQGAWGVREDK